MPGSAFRDPREFPFVAALEAAFADVRVEVAALGSGAFEPSPDSLTARDAEHDERGWLWFPLVGEGATDAHRARCPVAVRAAQAVPGLVNASLSLFRPATRLFPHCGELPGVLRCHLALVVPTGDCGLRAAGETRRWREGCCLVFDDSSEHTAWNLTDRDRIVLIATFPAS